MLGMQGLLVISALCTAYALILAIAAGREKAKTTPRTPPPRPAAQPMRPHVAPVCLHWRPVRVESMLNPDETLAYWCPDCETQLPPGFRGR